jgi:hypothetical protein
MGSATIEDRTDMSEKVIINLKIFLDGHNPADRVHPTMLRLGRRPQAVGTSLIQARRGRGGRRPWRGAHRA